MPKTNLGNMFKLLSVAWRPATEQSVEAVASGDLSRDVSAVWAALMLPEEQAAAFVEALAPYEGLPAEDVLHELRRDWSHMFMGTPPLIEHSEGPWRKLRLDGKRETVRMVNQYSLDVQSFMLKCGVQKRGAYNDCLDYLEEEFDFCAFLADSPDYLVEAGRDPLDLLQQFADEHLGVWAPGFCADVVAEARSPYYRALAQLTAQFVAVLAPDDEAAAE